MWANYHTHSTYCDGRNTLREMIEASKARNISILGFSSHAPLPFDCSWCMKKEKLSGYLTEIENLKTDYPGIQIFKGLEVDYIPNTVSCKDFEKMLDYTIGSIHFVEQLDNGQRWEIDGPHHLFEEGLHRIFKSNIKDTIHRYFELTREMIEVAPPEIVGHLDKIKIQNIGNKFFNESDDWYRQEVIRTLNVIKSRELIVEVNTRGIYQKKSANTYPSPWILRLMLEKEIPVTINSDAHNESDLVSKFSQTATLLLALGYKKLRILREGTWENLAFDENGYLLK